MKDESGIILYFLIHAKDLLPFLGGQPVSVSATRHPRPSEKATEIGVDPDRVEIKGGDDGVFTIQKVKELPEKVIPAHFEY